MPVRELLLDLMNDSVEGLIAGNGRFVAIPNAPRVDGVVVVLPTAINVDIKDGEFVGPAALEVTPMTPPQWYWQIRLHDVEDTIMVRRNVLVPPGADLIAVGDLPQIDPDTLVEVPDFYVDYTLAVMTQSEFDGTVPAANQITYIVP